MITGTVEQPKNSDTGTARTRACRTTAAELVFDGTVFEFDPDDGLEPRALADCERPATGVVALWEQLESWTTGR